MWKTRLSSENWIWHLPSLSHHFQPARLSWDTCLDSESKPENKYKPDNIKVSHRNPCRWDLNPSPSCAFPFYCSMLLGYGSPTVLLQILHIQVRFVAFKLSNLLFVEDLLLIKYISSCFRAVFVINEWPSCGFKLSHRAPSPHNCPGLMILVCASGFSDALFHLRRLVLHQLKVLAVVPRCFGALGAASDSHRRPDWGGSSLGPPPSGILSCPHVNPFQPDPPQRLPHPHPHTHPPPGPANEERATNWISWFRWEAPPPSALFSSDPSNVLCCVHTDEAEEDELFCTYGNDDSWCLLQFLAASPGLPEQLPCSSPQMMRSPWLRGWRVHSFWFLPSSLK